LENRKVLFMGAASLVDRLRQRHVQGRLPGYLRKLRRSDLLVVDDLGAARLTALEAELLVELLNGGERRMSFVVTTPLPLVEWDEFFGNDRLAIAIAGRQLSGAHVIESMGEPYRGFPVRAGALKTDRSGGTAEEPAKPVE
jgi:DNA replication protein DnaC